jgi:hypothetical protein
MNTETTTLDTDDSITANGARQEKAHADSAHRGGFASCSNSDNPLVVAAIAYHRDGLAVTPLNGKKPTTRDWQNSHHNEADLPGIFSRQGCNNIGLLLGSSSGGLADIDLDCVEARILAPMLLPQTLARFGRKSSPRSHWLYRVSPSSFKTERLADPEEGGAQAGDHKGAIIELRGDGAQTMAPPSIHPTGEPVTWEADFASITPAAVDLEVLRAAVRKLAAASLIRRRWNKLPRHDITLALTGALRHGGLSADETTHFVLAVAQDDEPEDRRRAVEDTNRKFDAGRPVAGAAKCLEIFGERTWGAVVRWLGLLSSSSDWEAPDPSILSSHGHDAPTLPLEVLGDWAPWLTEQALAKSCPVDYIAASLFAAVGGILGNTRGISAFDGAFVQRPIVWIVRVGGPSSGKSPAADPVHHALFELEKEVCSGHAEEIRRWEQSCAVSKAERRAYDLALKSAIADGAAPPDLPVTALENARPVMPRLTVGDATIEFLSYVLAGIPRSVVLLSDELVGWLGGFGRYAKGSAGADVAFWLRAYDGRSYVSDRLHRKEQPYVVEHLSISIDGSIQPEKFAEQVLSGADDGLAARCLYVYPSLAPMDRPAPPMTDAFALSALRRLINLPFDPYRVLILTAEANDQFHAWRGANSLLVEEASGMLQSWLGKQAGVVLRVALILRYLRWCSSSSASPLPPEPTDIDLGTISDAIKLIDDYFTPMARRVFGDAAIPEAERDATTIARMIVERKIGAERNGRYILNRRTDIQRKRINRIRKVASADLALDELREANWIRSAEVKTGGRPRGDFEVNPAALKLPLPSIRSSRGRRC